MLGIWVYMAMTDVGLGSGLHCVLGALPGIFLVLESALHTVSLLVQLGLANAG